MNILYDEMASKVLENIDNIDHPTHTFKYAHINILHEGIAITSRIPSALRQAYRSGLIQRMQQK